MNVADALALAFEPHYPDRFPDALRQFGATPKERTTRLARQLAADADTKYKSERRSIERYQAAEGKQRRTPTRKMPAIRAATLRYTYRKGARVELTGCIYVSDDCRHRTIRIDLNPRQARRLVDAWIAEPDDASETLLDVLADAGGFAADLELGCPDGDCPDPLDTLLIEPKA